MHHLATTKTNLRSFRKDLRALEREVGFSMASDTGCCGISLAQCHLLLEVEQRGRTNVTELAVALELDKSTLSRTVDAMCRAGLLCREIDPASRRQQIISLADQGGAKADSINTTCDGTYRRLFDFIPARKRAAVVESIGILAGAMRQMRNTPEA